jgi:leucyl/phenylalanyl-tRNA--protein transferase
MPVYHLGRWPVFPPVEDADPSGLLAVGGDLALERLLTAYRQGIFPWYEPGGPILWWSPDPRLILEPDALKISRSLRATLRKNRYEIRVDTSFAKVIHACAVADRKGEQGTWISPEVARAYTELHQQGYAHSVESWRDGELVGGLYGVSLGRCFFGESMFAIEPDASKVALVALVELLQAQGIDLIDCQVTTEHLLRMGAREVPRSEFLRRLDEALRFPDRREAWTWPPGVEVVSGGHGPPDKRSQPRVRNR